MAADLLSGPVEGGDAPGHAEQAQRKLVAFGLVTAHGIGPSGSGHAGQDLGVTQGVGDAVGGDRVLEVAGVTDQGPPGTRRLTEVTSQAGEDPRRAGRAALIEPFRFIPNWRIDDVMVSYAVDGGSVGPHFDQYDVFLVQGLGQRRWQIGRQCDGATPLLPHDDLRLLANFEATDEWVLEPGDILYVPPGYAHNGVAVGDDCMTYSIGFRAPSRGDLTTLRTSPIGFPFASNNGARSAGTSSRAPTMRKPRRCRLTCPRKWMRATVS